MSRYVGAAYGAGVALVGALLIVVTGNETLADVTVAEWLATVAAVLGSSAVAEVFSRKAPADPVAEPESTGRHAATDGGPSD